MREELEKEITDQSEPQVAKRYEPVPDFIPLPKGDTWQECFCLSRPKGVAGHGKHEHGSPVGAFETYSLPTEILDFVGHYEPNPERDGFDENGKFDAYARWAGKSDEPMQDDDEALLAEAFARFMQTKGEHLALAA